MSLIYCEPNTHSTERLSIYFISLSFVLPIFNWDRTYDRDIVIIQELFQRFAQKKKKNSFRRIFSFICITKLLLFQYNRF